MKYIEEEEQKGSLRIAFFLSLMILTTGCIRGVIKVPPGISVPVIRGPDPIIQMGDRLNILDHLYQDGRICLDKENSYVRQTLTKEEVIDLVASEMRRKLPGIVFSEDPADFAGQYPCLRIGIDRLAIKEESPEDAFVITGTLQITFYLYHGEIFMSDSVFIKKTYTAPIWRTETLPSWDELVRGLISKATCKWISEYFPHVVSLYRYAKLGGARIVKESAIMINGGNCKGAYEHLVNTYPRLKSCINTPTEEKSCNAIPYQVFYNAGLSNECMAWKSVTFQRERLEYLGKALTYYRKASQQAPQDTDAAEATEEVGAIIKIMREYPKLFERLFESSPTI